MSIAVLVMELSIACLLLGWAWVVIAGGSWPAPWPVFLAGPFGLIAGRLVPFTWRRLNWFDVVWWAAVAVVVAALAEVGNLLAAGEGSALGWNLQLVTGLLLAWRGWSLAEGWLGLEFVEAELQLGTILVLGMLLVLVWVVPGAGLLPAVTFAAAGLLGLGLARRAERRAPGAPPETDWLVLVGGLVASIVLVAVVVVLLVTPELLLAIVDQAYVVANLAVVGFAGFLQWIGSWFPGYGTTTTQTAPTGPVGGGNVYPTPIIPDRSGENLPWFWVYELLITFALATFLFFAVRALVRLMRTNLRGFGFRLPKQREPGPALSAADTFSWATWWRSVWHWLLGRVRVGGQGAGRNAEQGRDRAAAQQAEQRSIRALYREFLSAVARAGFERLPSTTPSELAREVNAARPAGSRSISTVTELYVRTRYGEEQLSRDELARMRNAVQQARRDLTPAERNEKGAR